MIHRAKDANGRGTPSVIQVRVMMLVSVILSLFFSGVVRAADCEKAGELSNRSLTSPDRTTRENLLLQALRLCPHRVEVLNNLALLREEQGRLRDAESLYYRVLAVDPHFIQAYAGLGDVQAADERYRPAAKSYRLFLEGLRTERQKGDPHGLAAHEPTYRRRMNAALAKTRQTVAAASIKRLLTTSAAAGRPGLVTRGLRPVWRDRLPPEAPRVDLHIRFDSGSARLSPTSANQLHELAMALRDPALARETLFIIGHTDSVGPAPYNQTLSEQRAETVRRSLIERGIDGARLQAHGMGETEPAAANTTPAGRAMNRRVTIVNSSKKPL